jgi:cholesterol transport system auxiliary component
MKNRATSAQYISTTGLFVIFFASLTACTSPRMAASPAVYDFGPHLLTASTLAAPSAATPRTLLPTLVLSEPQASPALEGTAVLYRLVYADAQQLKPYALARWSTPPAHLIGQRLRQVLSQQRAVVAPGELLQASPQRFVPSNAAAANPTLANPAPIAPAPVAPPQPPLPNLRLELEEFSQLFDTPNSSHALLRLRATLTQRSPGSETLLAQHSFVVQRPAPSADAAGGVRALTAAADAVVLELEAWLAQSASGQPHKQN